MGNNVIEIRWCEPIAFAQHAGDAFDGAPVLSR
jgi:hypothetical protein